MEGICGIGSCGLSKEYADGKKAAEVKSNIDGRWGKEREAIDGRRDYFWGIATAISTDGQKRDAICRSYLSLIVIWDATQHTGEGAPQMDMLLGLLAGGKPQERKRRHF